MWYFTEVADWFKKNMHESERALDQWVESSGYSTGTMVTASTTKAFMTFGAGFVDLLKLGDGVKEGTLKGVGEDALRNYQDTHSKVYQKLFNKHRLISGMHNPLFIENSRYQALKSQSILYI